MAKKIDLNFNGVDLQVEEGSTKHKQLMKIYEEALEEQMAQFVTSAHEKIKVAIRAAYVALESEEQLALAKRGIVAMFTGSETPKSVTVSVHQQSKIQIRLRNKKGEVDNSPHPFIPMKDEKEESEESQAEKTEVSEEKPEKVKATA